MSNLLSIIRNDQLFFTEIKDVLSQGVLRGNKAYGAYYKNRLIKHLNFSKAPYETNDISDILFKLMFNNDFLMANIVDTDDVHDYPVNIIQPIHDSKRDIVVTFDGFISNREELITKFSIYKEANDNEIIAFIYSVISRVNKDIEYEKNITDLVGIVKGHYVFHIYDNIVDKLIIFSNVKNQDIRYVEGSLFIATSEKPTNYKPYSNEYKYTYSQLPINTCIVVNPIKIRIENSFNVDSSNRLTYLRNADLIKSVVMSSGGLNSLVTGYVVKDIYKIPNITVLNVNYGNKNYLMDQMSTRYIAKHLKAELKNINMISVFKDLISENENGFPPEYISIKNGIFLNIAAAYAENINAKIVFSGTDYKDDTLGSFYSDNSFTRLANQFIERSTFYNIKVINPLSHLKKKDVVLLGHALNVPFESVLSCDNQSHITDLKDKKKIEAADKLNLKYIPCGKCAACKARIAAFNDAEIYDPHVDIYLETVYKPDRVIKELSTAEKKSFIEQNMDKILKQVF
jgi:7-cyano-7-deazaguanine synthase